MRASGRLTNSGLVQRNHGGRHNRMPFDLSDRLTLALLADVDSIVDLIALMFPCAAAPQAEWQDFEGPGRDADLRREFKAWFCVNSLRAVPRGLSELVLKSWFRYPTVPSFPTRAAQSPGSVAIF